MVLLIVILVCCGCGKIVNLKFVIGIGKLSIFFCWIGVSNKVVLDFFLNRVYLVSFIILICFGVSLVCSILLELVMIFKVVFFK